MECNCVQGDNFFFRTDFLNCKKLLYQDLSNWIDRDFFRSPETYTLTIEFPDGEEKEIPIKTDIWNEIDLPSNSDGIYCFSTEICGIKYTRSVALLCNLRCKLDNMISKVNTQPEWDEILLIEKYLEFVEISVASESIEKARLFLKLAKDKLNCKNCNCP